MDESLVSSMVDVHEPSSKVGHIPHIYLLVAVLLFVGLVFSGVIWFFFVRTCENVSADTWVGHRLEHCTVFAVVDDVRGDILLSDFTSTDYKWEAIMGVDATTFVEMSFKYGKDERAVYYGTTLLPSADAITFEYMGGEYARDGSTVYWQTQMVPNANPHDFTAYDDVQGIAFSDERVFYRGEEVPPANKEVVRGVSLKHPSHTLLLGELTTLIWDAPEAFGLALVALKNTESVTTWLTKTPINNNGVYAFTPTADNLTGGPHSVRLIALDADGQRALYYVDTPNIIATEGPVVQLEVNGQRNNDTADYVFVRQGETVTATWRTDDVRSCTFVSVNKREEVPASSGSRVVTIDTYEGGGPVGESVSLQCITGGGRSVTDTVQLIAYPVGTPDPVKITIESPNGGEAYKVGDTMRIKWSGARAGTIVAITINETRQPMTIGNGVRVMDSANQNGGTVITRRLQNNGSYDWIIPSNLSASAAYFVRVTCDDNTGNGGPYGGSSTKYYCRGDDSDATFSIGLTKEEASNRVEAIAKPVISSSYREIMPHIYTDGKTVFYDSGMGVLKEIYWNNVSPETIEPIDDTVFLTGSDVLYYFCATNMCSVTAVNHADRDTFEAVSDQYYRDKNRVYMLFKSRKISLYQDVWVIPGADPVTFQPLGYVFGKDKNRVYYADMVLEDSDPTTFAPFPASMGWESATVFRDVYNDYIYAEGEPTHVYEIKRSIIITAKG